MNILGIPNSLNFAVMGTVILIGVLADQQLQARRRRKAALAGLARTAPKIDTRAGEAKRIAARRGCVADDGQAIRHDSSTKENHDPRVAEGLNGENGFATVRCSPTTIPPKEIIHIQPLFLGH